MIRIESGIRDVWPGFSLEIGSPLGFEQGQIWQLKGPNGSGKSSFISQVLMPALKDADAYILRFEQQTSLQLQAVKAWAAIFHPGKTVRDEAELVSFLLDDLNTACARQPKPVWIVADELHHLQALAELEIPHCLIYSAHHQELQGAGIISFEPLNPHRSLLRA